MRERERERERIIGFLEQQKTVREEIIKLLLKYITRLKLNERVNELVNE